MALAVKPPTSVYRVDPGTLPAGRFHVAAQTFRSKGHAENKLHHMRALGFTNARLLEAVCEWVDITPEGGE